MALRLEAYDLLYPKKLHFLSGSTFAAICFILLDIGLVHTAATNDKLPAPHEHFPQKCIRPCEEQGMALSNNKKEHIKRRMRRRGLFVPINTMRSRRRSVCCRSLQGKVVSIRLYLNYTFFLIFTVPLTFSLFFYYTTIDFLNEVRA